MVNVIEILKSELAKSEYTALVNHKIIQQLPTC